MALFMPVVIAPQLAHRPAAVALPAADGRRDHHGQQPDDGRQLAADHAQRPAGVGQRQPAVGRGDDCSRSRCSRRADRHRAAGGVPGVLPFLRRQAAARTTGDESGVTPARTQSYFAKTYGIDGDVYELTVTADSPLVGMSRRRSRSAAWRAAAARAQDRQRIAPGAAGRCEDLGRQRARRDGTRATGRRTFRKTISCARRRACASSATCSIPVARVFPKPWCRRTRATSARPSPNCSCASSRASACSRSTAKRTCSTRTSAS